MYGGQIDTSLDNKLVVQQGFHNIDPGQIFAYWTEPELLCTWWPVEAAVEPHLGGAYLLAWPSMAWQLRGRYLAFDPPYRLAFTWHWDHEPSRPTRSVVVNFRAVPGGTLLTLGHGIYTLSAEDQSERKDHLQGWTHFMAKLQASIRVSTEAYQAA